MKVRVIGAGISGLSIAYFLQKFGAEVEVFERGAHSGGLVSTRRDSYGLVESAANGFLSSHLIEALCADVGVELIPHRRQARRRFIYRGRPRRWPLGILESLCAVWRFIWAKPRSPKSRETIADWGARVLGLPATRYLLSPALQGIYAGHIERMSATLILGRFFRRSAKKVPSKYRGLVAPRDGMGSLIRALEKSIRARGGVIHHNKTFSASEVQRAKLLTPIVVATSSEEAALLLSDRNAVVSSVLARIERIPLTTVTAFFEGNERDLKGFGCLFPADENFSALGVLFNDFIFTDRSAPGQRSETWIFRGNDKPDEELVEQIVADRRRLRGGPPDRPIKFVARHWASALPHYTLELEEILEKVAGESLAEQGIYLHGNYLGRLGLSQIIPAAKDLAKKVLQK